MQIKTYTLDNCTDARGVVVVIDVMRAFTTAAYAFAAGAREIVLAGSVGEALELGRRLASQGPVTVLGEAGGLPVAGFDFDNSPSQIARVDLRGHTVVQRTTSGVQGLLRCRNADTLLAGSFVVAGATLRCLRSLQPERLALVITGDRPGYRAVEDHALAEYLQAALQAPAGHPSDPQPYLQQVRRWQPTPGTGQDRDNDRLQRDLDLCSQINTFDFALPVWHSHGRLVMHANPLPSDPKQTGEA